MTLIIKILQLILSLSLIVVVHEFGHYFFARIFKIRVEKFYLFFPPAIFKFKPKKSDTEFGIGSIPLGGFCKISGMIDESMDKESLAQPPQPWELRSRPAWQKFFVFIGGVLMNVISAIIIYIGILFTWGEQYIKTSDAAYGIQTNELSNEIGFRDGDKLLAFDSEPVPENFADLQIQLVRNQVQNAVVLRDGDTIDISIDQDYLPAMLNTPGMFMLRTPIAVGSLPDTSINAGSGLLPGDKLLTVAGDRASFFKDLQNVLGKHKGETVPLTVMRGEDTLTFPVKVGDDGKIGILLQADISGIQVTERDYSLIQAIPAGFKQTFSSIGGYVKELGLIFSPKTEAYKSVGSFITIGSIFPSVWNWQIFWNITALLCIMLAVLNILPIPALDGGHLLFCIYEMITGKKPSDRFMEVAQMIGMFILLLLMILAFGNDIIRLFN